MLAETLSVAREIEVEFESQPEDDVSIATADMPLSEDDAFEDVTVDEFPTPPSWKSSKTFRQTWRPARRFRARPANTPGVRWHGYPTWVNC